MFSLFLIATAKLVPTKSENKNQILKALKKYCQIIENMDVLLLGMLCVRIYKTEKIVDEAYEASFLQRRSDVSDVFTTFKCREKTFDLPTLMPCRIDGV